MSLARAALVCLALALGATACGTSDSSTVSDAAVDVTSGAKPFDAVLIELFGTSDTADYLDDIERQAALLVQSCMNDAGFEFAVPDIADEFDPPDPASLDDAREMGFGIIAEFRYQLSKAEPSEGFAGDPNVAYLATLTRSEIERFVVTLDGVAAEPGQLKDDAGCNGFASDQAYADWVAFSEALPNYTALGEERDTHPDWIAARREWRECMIERDYDFAEPEVIVSTVTTRMRTMLNESYPNGQLPFTIIDGEFVVDPAVDAVLDELAEFERGAAVANVECAAPLTEDFDAVERLVQRQFVERNQATIDDLLS